MRIFAVIFFALISAVFAPGIFADTPPAPAWRDMLREYQRIEQTAPDLAKLYPDMAPAMARLGEALVRTAYTPDLLDTGRKNFAALVKNLGMAHPTPGDLRQFLYPEKKPYPGYTGPTGGNFHMLFNSGTLALDTGDGCSKNHPAFALCRRYAVANARRKQIMKTLAPLLRQEKAGIPALSVDAVLRDAFLTRFKESWAKQFPGDTLSAKELEFVVALFPFMA